MSLIRRKEDRKKVVKEEVQKGLGHLISLVGVEQDSEMWNRGRMLNENVLEKDCGVGYHVHQGDGEIYVILSGEAEYNDNGTITTVKAGDITFTGPGEGHAITNRKDEPMSFMAIILYE